MIFSNSDSSPETGETQPAATSLKIPRIASLLHRLQHARNTDGQPIRPPRHTTSYHIVTEHPDAPRPIPHVPSVSLRPFR